MKRFFGLGVNNKQTGNLYISGYSKIFKWIFNNTIRAFLYSKNNVPRLKERWTDIKYNISLVLSFKNPSFKEKFIFKNTIKVNIISLIRDLSRFGIQNLIKINIKIDRARTKERINNFKISTIKLIMLASFVTYKFVRLKEWDFKIPDQPSTSPRWFLYELDTKKLLDMDFK